MGDKARSPNEILRRIRVDERRQTRAEFAESLARRASELGESLTPSERYVARLEDGEIRFPHPAYRRVLAAECGRPVTELGFESRTPRQRIQPSIDLIPVPAYLASMNRAASGQVNTLGSFDATFAVLRTDRSWPDWFGIKLAHLISLIDRWQIQEADISALQAVLAQEILMFDASAPKADDPRSIVYSISRRQTLMTIAALPSAFAANALSIDSRSFSSARESFLTHCAASITACWHLLRGSDLDVVDDMMSSYLLPLEGIARQSSKHQHAAAILVSQTHRVRGIIALHRNQINIREFHCKQAYRYAGVASDAGSQASALISLASTYFYQANPEQAATVYERALLLESQLPPLQRSRVYAELAVVYGQLNRVDQALHSAEMAGRLYPDDPTEDPSYLYAEFTPASLALEQGLAFLALAEHHDGSDYQQRAEQILRAMDESASIVVPDRIRFEIVNHLARTSVLLGDADAFEMYIYRGIEGARLLGSSQREREARAAFMRAKQKWPDEKRLDKVSEHLQITDGKATEL
jgi:tetratricopeptide (TPR) repeat protein